MHPGRPRDVFSHTLLGGLVNRATGRRRKLNQRLRLSSDHCIYLKSPKNCRRMTVTRTNADADRDSCYHSSACLCFDERPCALHPGFGRFAVWPGEAGDSCRGTRAVATWIVLPGAGIPESSAEPLCSGTICLWAVVYQFGKRPQPPWLDSRRGAFSNECVLWRIEYVSDSRCDVQVFPSPPEPLLRRSSPGNCFRHR